MNLTFYSPSFYPRVGGLEGFLEDLAHAMTAAGVHLTVITTTPSDTPDAFPFKVLRNPSFWRTVQEIRKADYYVEVNVSLNGIPAWLFSGRPLIIIHQNLCHRVCS